MQRNTIHPSLRRALPWAAALLFLFFAGAGAVQADHGRRDDRDHRHGRGGSCDVHRGDHYRGDRGRYDHYRDRHDRYDRHRSYYGDRYDDRYGRQQRYRPYSGYFEIPGSILHQERSHYRGYHHGRVYHSPHRHYHEVYRFPVYSEHGVAYFPYAYCDGSFFARGVFRGGNAWFDFYLGF